LLSRTPESIREIAMFLEILVALTLAGGQTDPAEGLAQSVHAKLSCVDCHTSDTEAPQCRSCHFANYARTLDSVHQQAVARGDKTAPTCSNCHGSHGIKKAAMPRETVSKTCATCHEGVAAAYARSVHGRTLAEGNTDVPVCTDCHHAHDVAGPRRAEWEARTPELCGSCHANAAVMGKYGLSTKVFSTYLSDFHGKTAALRSRQGTPATGAVVARCTDCHGVHEIQKSSDGTSPVMKANLLKTCRQCHVDAPASFPGAWLSHYEPSFTRAPLVYGVKLGYAIIIPFMIGGLGLQILLHLWRLMANR